MSSPCPPPRADDGSGPLRAVACPRCFGALAVAGEQWGLPADCPLCGGSFLVPQPDGRQSAADATAPQRHRSPRTRRRQRPGTAAREPKADEACLPPDLLEAPRDREAMPAPQGEEPARRSPDLVFEEPVSTVGSDDAVVVLRRLSTAQKAARRARRNIVMLLAGVTILVAIVLLLGRKG